MPYLQVLQLGSSVCNTSAARRLAVEARTTTTTPDQESEKEVKRRHAAPASLLSLHLQRLRGRPGRSGGHRAQHVKQCRFFPDMSKTTVAVLCLFGLTAFRPLLCVQMTDDSACVVTSSYDLEYALASAAVCRVLELRANITLTSDNFSPQGLALVDESITIQPAPEAAYPVKLDFGTFNPTNAIQVTGSSIVTLMHLQLQNYLATPLQNGTTTTFMPLFNFDTTSSLHIIDVQLLMDAGRCAQDANFPQLLYQPRLSW